MKEQSHNGCSFPFLCESKIFGIRVFENIRIFHHDVKAHITNFGILFAVDGIEEWGPIQRVLLSHFGQSVRGEVMVERGKSGAHVDVNKMKNF